MFNASNAIGGWIKGAKPVVIGEYFRLEDFTSRLNIERLNYFEDYRTRYFFDCLLANQGVESIFSMLKTCVHRPTTWIDLGASVTTLFWSLGFNTNHLKNVEVCDLIPEALHILREFKETKEIPGCYADVIHLTNKSKKELSDLRIKQWTYHVFDCLGMWPSRFTNKKYSLITAVGCFGLTSTPKQYSNVFTQAATHISNGGTFAGVDWVRSDRFINDEGHNNKFLNTDSILHCGRKNNLINVYIEKVRILNDPYYDCVLIWAFKSN